MHTNSSKTVLILGANSDVAKEAIRLYAENDCAIIAASRSTEQLEDFVARHSISGKVEVRYFDAAAFETHQEFYDTLPVKPHIVVYAAGFLKSNEDAFKDWESCFQMMKVHYCGAVSILNIIITDPENKNLERIVGLSSLSGVRGRKSNFIYGSTKSAFTQYLAGLRQYLSPRKIKVSVIVAGYIRSKMVEGLDLPESLMLEPEYIARAVVHPYARFVVVPGIKWKMIYQVLRMLPERLVALLP